VRGCGGRLLREALEGAVETSTSTERKIIHQRENHVKDGIGHVISIFDSSVKSQKPEQRVGLKGLHAPNSESQWEAKNSSAVQIVGEPTVAVIYHLRRLKPEIMRIKSGSKRSGDEVLGSLSSLRVGCLSLVGGAYVVITPHLLEV
jgi:hypothetical protein